jgi:L-alanine-DL-glutamate epimerase-like enolase superfamily enzyme
MSVSIVAVEFYAYRIPLTPHFVWAFGAVKSATNIITILHSEQDGVPLIGIGESAPRSPRLTGDYWDGIQHVMRFAAERLNNFELPTDPGATVAFIAKFMDGLAQSIRASSGAAGDVKLFRGTLSGIEMALLDLAGRAHGVTVAEILGAKRSEIRVSQETVADALTPARLADRLKAQAARFPLCRLKGSGNSAENLCRLMSIAQIYRELGLSKPLWIDINGAFAGDAAREFIDQVAGLSREGRLPKQLIIEQPVPRSDLQTFAVLQGHADELAVAYDGEIVIMADEAVWDRADLDALDQAGSCRALNIKIQKAGGLIEALRTAELSIAHDPKRRICLGGFPGTGDVTAWAAINLARALPRLDYFGGPPSRVEHRIATPFCRFADDASNLLAEQVGPGLAVEIDLDAMRPLMLDHHHVHKKTNPPSLGAT